MKRRFKRLTPTQAYKALMAGEVVLFREKGSTMSWKEVFLLHENESVYAWCTKYDFRKKDTKKKPLLQPNVVKFGTWVELRNGKIGRVVQYSSGTYPVWVVFGQDRWNSVTVNGHVWKNKLGQADVVKVLTSKPENAPKELDW